MTIKVLEKTPGCLPEIIEKGDWVDLVTAEEITLKEPIATTLQRHRKNGEEERTRKVIFDYKLIPLGVCIEVPKGYESILVPKSSTFKKYGIIQTNSEGIIDQTYSSDEDEWKMPVAATRAVTIPKGTRIAQFRVQLSQKATFWQKIKWLFSGPLKIKKVESLSNPVREGFGSTGD
jgi:dUTP pyrophosphatase